MYDEYNVSLNTQMLIGAQLDALTSIFITQANSALFAGNQATDVFVVSGNSEQRQ